MEEKLREHSSLMQSEIKNIRQQLEKAKKKEDQIDIIQKAEKLHKYHEETVRNFQHERLIHLIVTLFFAGMTLFSVAGVFTLSMSCAGSNYSVASSVYIPALSLVLVLLILVGFYIKHYYQLENGTQKLYEFSKDLLDIQSKNG